MRALTIGPEYGIENLEITEFPDPQPQAGEVLVRMRAASLNYRDLMMVQGMNAPRGREGASEPIIPLSDGCGIVEAVGSGVTRFAPGDRVITLFFQRWISGPPTTQTQATALGGVIPGAARELAVFSEEGLSKFPEFLTDQQASTLPCAALTAWRGLTEDADLAAGDTVVLQGTGGVSIFGLQFARAAGYRTVITSSSDEKLERAKALGADHLVNYRKTPRWSKAVREVTENRGADFILEVGGPGTIQESMRAIRLAGHIAVVGIVAAPAEGTPAFSPVALISNSAKLQGLSVGSRDMFEAMCRAIDLHRITPVVDKVFPWTDARAAFQAMKLGEHFGKIVLQF